MNDRPRLLATLAREQRLPAGTSTDPAAMPSMTPSVASAIQARLAATPAKVMMVQLDDATGSRMQMNLPGTIDEYDNWRHKLPRTVEEIRSDAEIAALLDAVHRERP